MQTFAIILIIVIVVLFTGFTTKVITKFNEKKDEYQKYLIEQEDKEQNERQASKDCYDSIIARLGECAVSINYGSWRDSPEYNINKSVLVFEEPKIIVINAKEYKFSDILGYSLEDNATNETVTYSEGGAKTSTGNMLGRAAVGGLLTGGLGAVAGAATAKKNISTDSVSTTQTKHNYIMYVNVNNLQDPVLTLRIGDMSGKAQKLASILNIIIERNKQH